MFRFYVVPDATKLRAHSEIYSAQNMKLFWDPRSESDSYAIADAKGKAEINKASSLEFSILPTNVCYNDFEKKKSVVLAYDDDELIFEGVVSTNPKDFYKQRRITCTSPLTYLSESIQPPDEQNEVVVPTSSGGISYVKVPLVWYDERKPKDAAWYERTRNSSGTFEYSRSSDDTANPDKTYYYRVSSSGENVSGTTITKSASTRETIQAHIARILNIHNSQMNPFKHIFPGQINIDDNSPHDFTSTGWRTTWDSYNSDILEGYGKYTTVTTGSNGTLQLNYLDITQMSSETPVIEYTRNMIEMTESTDNSEDIFTVLVPIGHENLTVASASGHNNGGNDEIDPYIVSFGGERRYVVVSKAAVARYGYIVKTRSFGDVDDANELYLRAVQYIWNNYDYHTEYDVKAIDLKILGESNHRISIGDKCRLKSEWHEVDEKDLFVISAQYDYVNPENDSFKLGIPTSDKEAGNRRLSSQTRNNTKSGKDKDSNMASSSGRMSSILENYIHVTEWGLEMNSRLKNEVESNDKKYKTKFIQDEESLNLAAEKLFGVDENDRGDLDAGYIAIPITEYTNSDDGSYKNPVTEHWFEKNGNDYYLSNDTVADPEKQYYAQNLWSRYSDVDVGPGGIKARVDGNYERSTYCSSWIQSNEDSIEALTGHLYVDEEGHLHITSGSGMRTDHEEENTVEKFIQVPRSMYSQNPNPVQKVWYERRLDSSGAWTGQGQADSETNSSYYNLSHDTTADPNKYYYYRSHIRETFSAEYGVYDEDTLTAGVIARMVNNPSYVKVPEDEVNKVAREGGKPNKKGWWEYNASTGLFGLTGDTAVPRNSNTGAPLYKYYKVINNTQTYSALRGEHIVVGPPGGTVDPAVMAKAQKYIADKNLNGTITEIASDVVVVNALIAKYIESDVVIANTSLASDYIYAHEVDITTSTGDGYLNVNTISADDIGSNMIGTDYLRIEGVEFGSYTTEGGDSEAGNDPYDIVMAFDTPTYSGDDVKIRYRTAGMDDFDNTVAITFTKPASLGSVTWSSGSKTLTAKTVGGRDFLVGTISNFTPSGQDEAQQMSNAGYLATETSGYNQVYGLYYTYKNASGNDVQGKTMLFKTPKDRYNDGKTAGISEAKGKFGLYGPTTATADTESEGRSMNNASTLDYGKTYMVYKTYDGAILGSKTFFKTPKSNATSHSIDISYFDVQTNEPSGTKLTYLRNAILEAIRDGKWLWFDVTCGNSDPKTYYMDFR